MWGGARNQMQWKPGVDKQRGKSGEIQDGNNSELTYDSKIVHLGGKLS